MRSIISLLEVISPEELIILASLIGMVLTRDLDSKEKRVLGNLLFVINSAILTLASIEDLLTAQTPSTNMQTNINTLFAGQEKMVTQFEELQKQIQEIQLRLDKK
jgi:hypothetical protein